MSHHLRFLQALILLLLCAILVFAATNSFNSGYPKPGNFTTYITVKGKAKADTPNYKLNGQWRMSVWPVGGGVVKTTLPTSGVNATTGEWGEFSRGGYTSGVEHNVVVEVQQVRQMPGDPVTLWIATDPGKCKAK